MRMMSIAATLIAFALPALALAGPVGTYHVKGVNPDDGRDYTGTVKITRKGETYSVVWQIAGSETIGVGLGLRLVGGQMVAGPASDADTGIAISYSSDDGMGNATYSEFSDGTWRGVWASGDDRKLSTEEWIPAVRQIKVKSDPVFKPKTEALKSARSEVQEAKVEDIAVKQTPARIMSSPMPASASPKS